MEKIEFTNPESKEHNEEVRNYLELMRDTESLIGDGMEKLKGPIGQSFGVVLISWYFIRRHTKEIWLFSKLDATSDT